MPAEIISILSQLPVVLVFIWYSERVVSSFQRFLVEERMSREKSDDATRLEIRELREKLIDHDSRVASIVADSIDKTANKVNAVNEQKSRPRARTQ